MKVILRLTQPVRHGKWEELMEIQERFDPVESRVGLPDRKLYHCIYGSHPANILMVEYEWDSLAAMEAAWEKAMADPEWQALSSEIGPMVESTQWEVYRPLR